MPINAVPSISIAITTVIFLLSEKKWKIYELVCNIVGKVLNPLLGLPIPEALTFAEEVKNFFFESNNDVCECLGLNRGEVPNNAVFIFRKIFKDNRLIVQLNTVKNGYALIFTGTDKELARLVAEEVAKMELPYTKIEIYET